MKFIYYACFSTLNFVKTFILKRFSFLAAGSNDINILQTALGFRSKFLHLRVFYNSNFFLQINFLCKIQCRKCA